MFRVSRRGYWMNRAARVISRPAVGLISACLAVLVCAANVRAALHIVQVSSPSFIDLNIGSLPAMMDPANPQRQSRLEEIATLLSSEAASQGQLIVIRPADFTLTYSQLSQKDQDSLVNVLGSATSEAYERGIAAVLQEVLSQVHGMSAGAQVSVFGLPFESGNADAANQRFLNVISGCSVLVSSRSIIVAGSKDNEANAARRSLTTALSMAEGRNVVYRCNGEWRQARVDDTPGAVDVYPGSIKSLTQKSEEAAVAPAEHSSEIDGLGDQSSTDGESGATGQSGGGATAEPEAGATGSGGGGGGGGGGGSGGGGTGAPHGGGGFAGGGGPGGNNSNPDAPPPPGPVDPPTTPTLGGKKLFVSHAVSASVHTIYPQTGAKDAITIYTGDIDSNNDGVFDPAALEASLNLYVPPDYTGPVALDWEGVGSENLALPIGSPELTAAVNEWIRALQKARQVRPNAQFGFYGIPWTLLTDWGPTYVDRAMAIKPIFDHSHCLFPSLYRFYADNQPQFSAADNRAAVMGRVSLALRMAEGKPVYPFVNHRYHEGNLVLGRRLLPESELKDHVRAIFDAEYNGKKVGGIVWWGADQYYYWMATTYPTNPPPQYWEGPLFAQVFAEEMAPGETAAQHFTRIHKRTLRRLADVIRLAQAAE